MPLLIRALPLSIVTLWHYVFVLPLVVIVMIPFILLTLIPLLGLPMLMAIVTFITFAGYRCALAAFGKSNEPSFSKLFGASFFWGLINMLATVVLAIVGFGIGAALKGLNFPLTLDLPGLEAVPYVTALGALIFAGLATLFVCAVAVPMTDAAHSASSGRGDSVPFFGFGEGLFSLLIVFVASSAGMWALGTEEKIGVEVSKALTLVVANYMQTPLEEAISFDWIGIVIAVLFHLWLTCWFCATAVLAWDRRMRAIAAAKEEVVRTPRMSADDLRALRESRMQTYTEPE